MKLKVDKQRWYKADQIQKLGILGRGKSHPVLAKLEDDETHHLFLQNTKEIGLRLFQYVGNGDQTIAFAITRNQLCALTIEGEEWENDNLFLQPILQPQHIASGLYYEVRPRIRCALDEMLRGTLSTEQFLGIKDYFTKLFALKGELLGDITYENLGLLWDNTPVLLDKGYHASCLKKVVLYDQQNDFSDMLPTKRAVELYQQAVAYRKSLYEIYKSGKQPKPPSIEIGNIKWDGVHKGKQDEQLAILGLEYGKISGVVSDTDLGKASDSPHFVHAVGTCGLYPEQIIKSLEKESPNTSYTDSQNFPDRVRALANNFREQHTAR